MSLYSKKYKFTYISMIKNHYEKLSWIGSVLILCLVFFVCNFLIKPLCQLNCTCNLYLFRDWKVENWNYINIQPTRGYNKNWYFCPILRNCQNECKSAVYNANSFTDSQLLVNSTVRKNLAQIQIFIFCYSPHGIFHMCI